MVVSGANVHDAKRLDATLRNSALETPDGQEVHLCADAGYVGANNVATMLKHGYVPHVRPRNEEKAEIAKDPNYRARRWVVEACHSWLNRFRKILVRFEKTLESHLALLHFAFAIICWRNAI